MHELKRIVGLQNDAFDLHIAKISTILCESRRLSVLEIRHRRAELVEEQDYR